jgi:hypothetical protein
MRGEGACGEAEQQQRVELVLRSERGARNSIHKKKKRTNTVNSVNPVGRLAPLHSDPGWEGAVVDDSSPISPRGLKCCRPTGQIRIDIKFLKISHLGRCVLDKRG